MKQFDQKKDIDIFHGLGDRAYDTHTVIVADRHRIICFSAVGIIF